MAHVCILMATYNGAAFLQKQLNSFLDQSQSDWSLVISDDGSTDATLEILQSFKDQNPQRTVHILNGPQKGFAKNFLSLMCCTDLPGDFFACADQDDIWKRDKLKMALKTLKTYDQGQSVLYCSRTEIIDEAGQTIGYAPLCSKPPSFRNALVQSLAGGNTMVFNKPVLKLAQSAGQDLDIISHDWWLYMLVAGCGGVVIYDRYPTVCYRSHTHNVIGPNHTIRAQWNRLHRLLKGEYTRWNRCNIKALEMVSTKLTTENRYAFDMFKRSLQAGLFHRLKSFWRGGFYRQKRLQTMALMMACFFNLL